MIQRLAVILLVSTAAFAGDSAKHPVLVELFTSEGCSSCPPADALLVQLDKLQPVPGAEILVLGEHVDYWDHGGWRDRFSSPKFTARQGNYASRFHLDSVYTPQIVVDGEAQVLGSDKDAALQAVEQASRAEKVDVKLTMLPGGLIRVDVAQLPSSFKGNSEIFLATVDDNATSEVQGGENKGRHLQHVAVVRNLSSVGTVNSKANFSKEVSSGKHSENPRFIAFVQEPHQGKIIGSTMLTPATPTPTTPTPGS